MKKAIVALARRLAVIMHPSDLDTVMVDSLIALDLSRPIREADISSDPSGVTSGTIRDRGRSARPFLA